MVSRAIQSHNRKKISPFISEIIIHTGQHYDYNLSQIFFDQMEIPKPQYHLGVGSGNHGEMTGEMLLKIENVLIKEKPNWVLVYGDTNSTLAGALAAVKFPIPVAHVEAGLRSFNRQMPEEINRILTDRISNLLFCPTNTAVKNLENEGIVEGVYNVGDVMYDSFLYYKNLALRRSNIFNNLCLKPYNFCLATVHRQENTDTPQRLCDIFAAFSELASAEMPFVIPLHPRTRKALINFKIKLNKNPHLRIISPVSYLDLIFLECHAHVILTDSGGMQKEAFFVQVPCITLREETEWTETVEYGWNILSGAKMEKIIKAFKEIERAPKIDASELYGRWNASTIITDFLTSKLIYTV